MNDKIFRFTCEMQFEEWGKYKEGDIEIFIIRLDSLVRSPIDSQWRVLSCSQFTGHIDKHNKLIFHGDIVKHKYRRIWKSDEHTSKVVWNHNYSCYYLNDGISNHRMRDDVIYEVINPAV